MTTAIPILPDIPKARYDELLGSWFSRVASANQIATWKHLLTRCGYEKNGQPPVDMGGPNERYELLCRSLRTTYASLQLELTTLLFWLFFEASPTECIYEGDMKIPARIIAGRRHSGSGIRGKLVYLKYCPSCLTEQLGSGRGTHWRRSHQLPVSFVCLEHKTPLWSACFSCGRIPELHPQRILKMPRRWCVCGADLAAPPISTAEFIAQLHSLSQFGFKAMNAGLPTWDRSHVLAAALAVIRDEWRGKITSAFDAMEAYFGLERYSKYGLRFAKSRMHPNAASVILQGVPSAWSASTFAAFFVASGVEFTALQDALSKRTSNYTGIKLTSAARRRPASSAASIAEAGNVPVAAKATIDRPQRYRNRVERITKPYSSPTLTDPKGLGEKLHDALRQVLSSQKWPSRVTVLALALAFGASEQKLRKLIATESAFKEEMNRINDGSRISRIRWKFRQLALQRRSVAITVFLHEISLMKTASNQRTVLEVANEQPDWLVLIQPPRNGL